MLLKKWDDLPINMKCDEVKKYYDILVKRKGNLVLKRIFDLLVASLMLIIVSPLILILAISIKMDSNGPVLFKQIRITTYGKEFKILKFRSMVDGEAKGNGELTITGDKRITKVGALIRQTRLDELPQLVNIIKGDMSFVGTRPEVPRYVNQYTKAMLATLLLPAGVTSEASILYKDEYRLLSDAANASEVYVTKVLPGKMYYNLNTIKQFSFWRELRTMMRTIFAVCGKDYKGEYQETTITNIDN